MSDYDDTWLSVLEDTHTAVCVYASFELDALARRTIVGLQRCPASGIYGDGFRFKTVWDEYCHDCQRGPAPALEWTWNETVGCFIDDAVERLPQPLRLLVSIGAVYERDESDDNSVCVDPRAMREAVRALIDRAANDRSMKRFYPAQTHLHDDNGN